MLRYPRAIAVFLILGGGLLAVSANRVPEDLERDIQELEQSIVLGDAGAAKQAEALAKKYELDDVMHLFKPPRKKGLDVGVGPKGIELYLVQLANKPLTPKELAEKRQGLQSMGDALVAITAVLRHQGDQDRRWTAKQWREMCDEMEKSSRELTEAATRDEPKRLFRAASRLRDACNKCH